jgi:hypothetical protein
LPAQTFWRETVGRHWQATCLAAKFNINEDLPSRDSLID